MSASCMANHPDENVARSPIFKQQNIQSTKNLVDNSFSYSKMRSEICKLKPEDLEGTNIDSAKSTLIASQKQYFPILQSWLI